jgi:hypothetical protein
MCLTTKRNSNLSSIIKSYNASSSTIMYKCPSMKKFQLPLIDFKIIDILKRHELTLPEINRNKEIFDPIIISQVNKQLPNLEKNGKTNTPMRCSRSLYSEVKWRKRKMNKKKLRKYKKKMFFEIQKRKQAKEKRYQNILTMLKSIEEKRVEIFDPEQYINRELEKAKFFGYKCSPDYEEMRKIINEKMVATDDRYFRKFEDKHIPLHIKYSDVFEENPKKRRQTKTSTEKK